MYKLTTKKLSILILFACIVAYSDQIDFEKILYSNQINYTNINKEPDWIKFEKGKSTKIEYKSIPDINFAYFISIKTDNKKIIDQSMNGLYICLIDDNELEETKTTYDTDSPFQGDFKEEFIIKFNNDNITCTKQTSKILNNNEKTEIHSFNITEDNFKDEIHLRISYYNSSMYFEIYDEQKDDYFFWFIDSFTYSENKKFRVKVICNLIGEEKSFEIGNIYTATFNWLKSKNNDIIKEDKHNEEDKNKNKSNDNKEQNESKNEPNIELSSSELNDLYNKLKNINDLIHNTLNGYETLLSEFESYSYSSLIEDNFKKIKQISSLTELINNSSLMNNNNDSNNEYEINKLMNLIRNSKFDDDFKVDKYTKDQEILINKLNDLDKKQQEMNQTIISLYKVITNSMNEISLSTNKLEKYNFIKKFIFVVSLISIILLLYLIHYLNNFHSTSSTNKQIKLPRKEINDGELEEKPEKLEII